MMRDFFKHAAGTLTAGVAATALLLPAMPAASEALVPNRPVSAEFPYEKKAAEVLGERIAYIDEGSGPVVLFLHGNPTSSYLWRNIIPYAAKNHRVVAPNLIGMGDSSKPDINYTFADHVRYVDGFIEAMGLRDITLVVHDWGSVLGMRYARRNLENVRVIAFMEALVPPGVPVASYDAMGPLTGGLFRALRTPGLGESMILQHNFFVETVLGRMGSGRTLSEAEILHYRAPFAAVKDRLPTLAWPRQIPIAGEPADVAAEIEANGDWLYSSGIPKLYFHAQPGALMPPPVAKYVIVNALNLTHVDLGSGSHFLQESSPHEIGAALKKWLLALE